MKTLDRHGCVDMSGREPSAVWAFRPKPLALLPFRWKTARLLSVSLHGTFIVLNKKLKSIRNTNEYRSYALNKAKDAYTLGRAKVLLTRRAIRNKFRVNDVQSAFRNFANSIKLENKHFQGERGLEMIAHQKSRLRDFLKK